MYSIISCINGLAHDYVVHVHMTIVSNAQPFYSLQYGDTPLHLALRGGHTSCVEHLVSTPGIDVNMNNEVS